MASHLMAAPVLDRGAAADRLRNHLRRRAITRPGLITGDLYFLPYRLAAGQGPDGESVFYLLAAEPGDPRLSRADLPAADLKTFTSPALPEDARLVEPSLPDEEIARRACGAGWRVSSLGDLIHYPFWLMRVEDSGRTEGAWLDGVEGKIIHHTLKVPPPVPPLARVALWLAAPAAAMGGAAWLWGPSAASLGAAAALSMALFGLMSAWLARQGRRQRGA